MTMNIQKLEGLAIFIASTLIYFKSGNNWLIFVIGLLLVDLSMVGYLKDTKTGAFTYNLVHNYFLGIILALIGFIIDNQIILMIGLIVTAHVGMDRFLGFGLKYPDNFKHTHLS
jgi:hypothetical protein